MPHATGPWCRPPEVPDDPKTLCLVLIEHPRFGRSYQIMRFIRNNWQFQEGLGFGTEQRVVRWARINKSDDVAAQHVREGAGSNSR